MRKIAYLARDALCEGECICIALFALAFGDDTIVLSFYPVLGTVSFLVTFLALLYLNDLVLC